MRDQASIYLGDRGRSQCCREAVTHLLALPGAARSLPHHITEVQSHEIAMVVVPLHNMYVSMLVCAEGGRCPDWHRQGHLHRPWSDPTDTKGICAGPHIQEQKSLWSDVFLSHGGSGL